MIGKLDFSSQELLRRFLETLIPIGREYLHNLSKMRRVTKRRHPYHVFRYDQSIIFRFGKVANITVFVMSPFPAPLR